MAARLATQTTAPNRPDPDVISGWESTAHHESDLQWRDRRSAELLSDITHTDQERTANIDQVVEINMSIADSVARRYSGRGVDVDDLTQVARLGLVQAARRFRPETGEFHSFAIPTVTGEVKRYFRDQCWSIRPPRRLQELRHDIAVTWPYLAQENARTPESSEIADRLDANRNDVAEALSEGTFRLCSLDAPGLAASDTVGQADDGFEQIDDAAEHSDLMRSIQIACRQLGDDDREILRMRYEGGCTQATIATKFQVSQMSISRRLARIVKTLRTVVQSDEAAAADSGSDREHHAEPHIQPMAA